MPAKADGKVYRKTGGLANHKPQSTGAINPLKPANPVILRSKHARASNGS